MEILGLSPSTPKPESRWKSIFWPAIRHEVDVDYIGRQGFWICLVVALFNLAVSAVQGLYLSGVFESAFYFLGGIGVRQRSRFAAIGVFSAYLLSTFVLIRLTGQGFSIVRIIFLALLLANVRGTWLSANWRSESTEPPPVPLGETLMDKLTDRLPIYLWPMARWVFYVLTVLENVALLVALFAPRNLLIGR